MNGQTGHSIRSVEPSDLEKARDLARNAIQWLARLANSYIPAEQLDRHLMLEWHAGRRSLVTRTFGDGLSLELRFPDLHLQFAGNGKLEPHVLDIEDHTPAEVEAWILVELLHRDVDRSRFSKALPYTVPRLLTGDSTDYSPASCMPALAAITDWLEYGTEILRTLAPAGTSLYCWPETFQIGRLIAMDGAGAERWASIANHQS